MDNEKIIRKIKGLLNIARENGSDEEGQSALVLAQRLMLQNNISEQELGETEASSELITENDVTIHKKIHWWEERLGNIIAENFRVKMYYRTTGRKSTMVFYGIEKDLNLAKEMYLLAHETVIYYSKRFVRWHYLETGEKRNRGFTTKLKKSYIIGFLDGVDAKFREQIFALREEYEVLILMPEKVEKSFESYAENFRETERKQPQTEVTFAYISGHQDGSSIDFTKRTIKGVGN
ncbi:DUF2786 domain-containing protein [Listeria seeligeri]|uniref:DUF2786 domain-containing protein n=1 Tax=Listeria seeligeri TaxID=1640 RepID=UPI0001C4EC80|nr:DUF2786 domain-containing protein [Listeria seeligeri]CBH27768.1 hypothetical protein lse_1617 [Listeria seeligeri serovar 1/2b str. SLCC3954]